MRLTGPTLKAVEAFLRVRKRPPENICPPNSVRPNLNFGRSWVWPIEIHDLFAPPGARCDFLCHCSIELCFVRV